MRNHKKRKNYVFYVSMCFKKTSYNVIKKEKTMCYYVFQKRPYEVDNKSVALIIIANGC